MTTIDDLFPEGDTEAASIITQEELTEWLTMMLGVRPKHTPSVEAEEFTARVRSGQFDAGDVEAAFATAILGTADFFLDVLGSKDGNLTPADLYVRAFEFAEQFVPQGHAVFHAFNDVKDTYLPVETAEEEGDG